MWKSKREAWAIVRRGNLSLIKRAELVGELKQIQEQIKRLELELKTDYKDAEILYKKVKIQQSTDAMAVSDLNKYAKALEM